MLFRATIEEVMQNTPWVITAYDYSESTSTVTAEGFGHLTEIIFGETDRSVSVTLIAGGQHRDVPAHLHSAYRDDAGNIAVMKNTTLCYSQRSNVTILTLQFEISIQE